LLCVCDGGGRRGLTITTDTQSIRIAPATVTSCSPHQIVFWPFNQYDPKLARGKR
jgi:hypothetical protein